MNVDTNNDKLVELVISLHDQGVTDSEKIISSLESEFSLSEHQLCLADRHIQKITYQTMQLSTQQLKLV
jgi:hypothetical protein